MGWSFRKSKKVGPFRFSIGKRSASVSVGGPMGRITVNSDGRATVSTGVGPFRFTDRIGGNSRRTTASQSDSNFVAQTSPSELSQPTPLASSSTPINLSQLVQQFFDWIRRLLGRPSRNELEEQLASAIYRDIREQRQSFKLERTVARYSLERESVETAVRIVYLRLLRNVWEDGEIKPNEHRLLARVAEILHISKDVAAELNLNATSEQFGRAHSKAMEDGVIEEHEERYLNYLADSAGFADFNQFLEAHFYERSPAGIAAAKSEADEAARVAAVQRAEEEAAEYLRRNATRSSSTFRSFGTTSYVRGYYRKDGTYVQPHSRRR